LIYDHWIEIIVHYLSVYRVRRYFQPGSHAQFCLGSVSTNFINRYGE